MPHQDADRRKRDEVTLEKSPHGSPTAQYAADLAEFDGQVVLSDPGLLSEPSAAVFSLGYWRSRAAVTGTAPGRGSVWFVKAERGQWALRHYRRGGLVSRLIEDHYFWLGQDRVRSIVEWRLLQEMHAEGLPVPRPVAAGYAREGLFYTCNLLTEKLPEARTLAVLLGASEVSDGLWSEVGRVIRRFHDGSIDHADLNAHNILINTKGQVFLIDFDRAQRRPPGAWQQGNLSRLKRSVLKVCPASAAAEMEDGWRILQRSYAIPQNSEPH
jgi:3-deoxy-D-manno-octulosonic acid kinase